MSDQWIDDIREARKRGEEVAAGRRTSPKVHRSEASRPTPAQVYSIRIPAEHLARLKSIADGFGEPASALMRRWVIDRLDEESAVERALTEALPRTLPNTGHPGGSADVAYSITWPHPWHLGATPAPEDRRAG